MCVCVCVCVCAWAHCVGLCDSLLVGQFVWRLCVSPAVMSGLHGEVICPLCWRPSLGAELMDCASY